MRLVIHPGVEPDRLARIREAAGAMEVVNAGSADEALRAMPASDAYFGKITPPLLAAATRLRWVQSATVSLEHYVFPALVDHPCILTNMRGLFSDVIADQVLGYIICFARNLHIYIRNQQKALWVPVGGEQARVNFAAGPSTVNAIDLAHRPLAGAMLGVVGFGNIGQEIARRGLAFGMRILAVDPVPNQCPDIAAEVWNLDRLPELLAASDYVVVAAPHTPDTARMFRRPHFELMKRSAVFINIGRGAIVDLAELTAVLQEGKLGGAALDVFEIEPLPAEHLLWQLENVIITPHVAGYSPLIAARHLALLLENIRRFVKGEPLRNVVNKAMWF